MGDLRAVRWTVNGDDRLYVMQGDGIQVGWVDLVSGERHVVAAAMRREVDAVVAAYVRDVPGLLTSAAADDATEDAARTPAGSVATSEAPDASASSRQMDAAARHASDDDHLAELRRRSRSGPWWRDGWR